MKTNADRDTGHTTLVVVIKKLTYLNAMTYASVVSCVHKCRTRTHVRHWTSLGSEVSVLHIIEVID